MHYGAPVHVTVHPFAEALLFPKFQLRIQFLDEPFPVKNQSPAAMHLGKGEQLGKGVAGQLLATPGYASGGSRGAHPTCKLPASAPLVSLEPGWLDGPVLSEEVDLPDARDLRAHKAHAVRPGWPKNTKSFLPCYIEGGEA